MGERGGPRRSRVPPRCPFGGDRETTFVATWPIAIDDVPDAQQAAEEARGRQLDTNVTESLWTVTDAVGRTRTVHCSDPDLA
jgi:hypothetical protein